MIRKISYRFCSSLMAMLFLATAVYSQSDPPDTDTTEVTVIEETDDDGGDSADEETTTYYPDTLKQRFRPVVHDSIMAIIADKGFYYKTYLDSLLRASKVKAEKPKRDPDLQARGFFDAFGIIFWILAIGLFGYLVYRLFLSNSSLFSRSRKNISSDIEISSSEDVNDPDALLRNAIKNGNYRLAVRYLYLEVLNKLAERKMIELNTNKTNYEYVNEMRKHKFANDFASLTLQYDYVWYGEYPVDAKLFEQIQNSFTRFNKNLTR